MKVSSRGIYHAKSGRYALCWVRTPNLQLRAKPPLPVHYTAHVFIFCFFSPHIIPNRV
jgi:hypothetical protein